MSENAEAFSRNHWDLKRRQWTRRRIPVERRRLHPIIPLIFYTGEQRWETPIGLAHLMDLPALCERFVPRWETLMLPLHETPPATLTRFATAIEWAISTDRFHGLMRRRIGAT